MHQVVNFLS